MYTCITGVIIKQPFLGGILDLYIFLGPTPEQVVEQYTQVGSSSKSTVETGTVNEEQELEQYTQVGNSSQSTVETGTVSEEQELEQYTQVGSSSQSTVETGTVIEEQELEQYREQLEEYSRNREMRSRSLSSTPRSEVEYRSRCGGHCKWWSSTRGLQRDVVNLG